MEIISNFPLFWQLLEHGVRHLARIHHLVAACCRLRLLFFFRSFKTLLPLLYCFGSDAHESILHLEFHMLINMQMHRNIGTSFEMKFIRNYHKFDIVCNVLYDLFSHETCWTHTQCLFMLATCMLEQSPNFNIRFTSHRNAPNGERSGEIILKLTRDITNFSKKRELSIYGLNTAQGPIYLLYIIYLCTESHIGCVKNANNWKYTIFRRHLSLPQNKYCIHINLPPINDYFTFHYENDKLIPFMRLVIESLNNSDWKNRE